MTGTTADRTDPRLTHGVDTEPTQQADVYLVLSEEERAKGFVRPLRRKYVHMGIDPVLDGSVIIRYGAGGCGALTTMGLALSETYARQPDFYGATYCVGCQKHRPVGEFRWDEDDAAVGS